MSIQFGDILKHNNLLYPIVDINDVKGGLRSIATFSSDSLISEYASIPEKYRTGHSLLLETSTSTIYYLSGIDATNPEDWSPIIGQNAINTIIESAGFSISLNELTMNAEWIWSINNVEYTNLVENVFTIPLTTSGFIRIDLIVANTSGTFDRIEGIESDTVPVAPEAPFNTIQATFITVVDSGIVVVSAPTNGNYIIKDEKYITDVDTLTINEEVTLFRNCNYKISDGISQISGFKFYSSILARFDLQIYVGKEYIIYNNGLSYINLVHNSGSVNLPMILNGGIDFSLAPGDSARFLLQDDNTLLHIDYKQYLQHKTIKTITGTTYSLILEDKNRWLKFTNNSSITVTVPDLVFSNGDLIEGYQMGNGQISFTSSVGVKLTKSADEELRTALNGAVFGLKYDSVSSAHLFGKLELL